MKKFKINSLRVEKYVAKIEKGNKNIICTRYVFNCIEGEKNYELQLYYKYNENYFGEAILNLKEVKCFSGVSYYPKINMDIEFDELDEIIENDAFSYNKRKIVIKFDNFIETVRLKKKRPVWIFRGQSVLGKSYLAMLIYNGSQLDVYETDISDILPDIITADVIVLGNRVKFDVTDIEKRIFGEHETILVDFNKK